jgi:predicted PurR-regulated permease PerM
MPEQRDIVGGGTNGSDPSPTASAQTAGGVPGPGPRPTRRGRLVQRATARHVPLEAITVAIGLVVATYVLGKLLYILRGSLLVIVVAGFVAIVLNPPVAALQKRLHRRGLAVVIVTVWALLVFAGLTLAFGRPLVDSLTHLAHGLPGYVVKAEHGKGLIGRLIRRYQLQTWVQHNSQKLISLAEGLSQPALAVGKGALSVLVWLGTSFILVVLFLQEGPKLRASILGLVSPARSARYQRLGSEISRSVSGFVLGDMLTSIIAGIVIFITLTALSVPYALLWALWVALVDFLPTVGGALAGIPTVLFALAHSFTAAVITAVVFLAYQQIENHVLNPLIMSRTVKVNPLLVMVAVLLGADLGDWVGGIFGAFAAALLAIPMAGILQVVVKDVWRATSPSQPGPDEVQALTQTVTPGGTPPAPEESG